jgi:hypothetical protein
VAHIGRLHYTGPDVSWEQIVEKPRGETGKALSEVLETYGESAEGLGDAVMPDYQPESGAAYLDPYG